MTTTTWLPATERVNGAQAGGDLVGGPPRMVHHITFDALNPRPSFDAVRDYLVGAGFEPHLIIDPFTGRVAQFLPFDRSGYALRHNGQPETNRMGTACIQVEWYFTPGMIVAGKRYATLADTPMLGWDKVIALAHEYFVPDTWPSGPPVFSGAPRDGIAWAREAGHYGHCHIPENDHVDPGPMPAFPGPKTVSAHLAHVLHLAKIGKLSRHLLHLLHIGKPV